MPELFTIPQLTVLTVLGTASVGWLLWMTRILRRNRSAAARTALPYRRRTGPHQEAVELTPAEQDAFTGLVRRLDDVT
ncbi:hypothetical protein OG562_17690 [Streptomyces sp. NBC_01275]|uniref:hypothetical protein n=1 Tax=Streptomyces sp. NBC_01275 TaxID=2903807 RepID=UPI00225491EA|nr:hypothetical protein [Streptomyces sp. NBC_01275]MCX4762777.1 hypothetical protein [Streptomyces sp. NBC_01275]